MVTWSRKGAGKVLIGGVKCLGESPYWRKLSIMGSNVENVADLISIENKSTKSVSLKPHSVELFIAITLKTLETWRKISCLMTD